MSLDLFVLAHPVCCPKYCVYECATMKSRGWLHFINFSLINLFSLVPPRTATTPSSRARIAIVMSATAFNHSAKKNQPNYTCEREARQENK